MIDLQNCHQNKADYTMAQCQELEMVVQCQWKIIPLLLHPEDEIKKNRYFCRNVEIQRISIQIVQ
jgi:hypothetical protein